MKLIIDIPEDLYKWIKDEYDNPNGEVAYSAIENGTPYNPTGDLISREALKKDIEENSIILEGVQAIEVDCVKVLIDMAVEQGV